MLDSKIRGGEFKPILPYKPPLILGHDPAGVVVRVGPHVTAFKPGDAVYGRPRDGRLGTFAEYIAVDAAVLALKPANQSMGEAASIPLVVLTAWPVLVATARRRAGPQVSLSPCSGDVGPTSIHRPTTY